MQQSENEPNDKAQRQGMVGIYEETAFGKEMILLPDSFLNALGRQSDGQHHAQQDPNTIYITNPRFSPEDKLNSGKQGINYPPSGSSTAFRIRKFFL